MAPAPRPLRTAAACLFAGGCLAPDLPPPADLFVGPEYSATSDHAGGPGVLIAPTGPARFAGGILELFDGPSNQARARSWAAAGVDPAATLRELGVTLEAAGFGAQPGLSLGVSLAAEGGAPFVFATIEGATRPHEAVVLVAHTGSEATAEGGAHGAAAQLGLALVLAKALAADELAAPARSVLLLWGADPAATRTWLASGSHYVVAAVHGHGALAPPPAALHLERALELGPGGESAGAGPRPDGLAVVARCAQADVARLAGGLVTSEGPFSDGGARRPFVAVGVPSVVFRVAADEAAGESLGRLAAAAGATALALADPLPGDLERYLLTNRAQLDARVSAATAASDDSLAPRWRERCTRVRHWFRALCLGGGG